MAGRRRHGDGGGLRDESCLGRVFKGKGAAVLGPTRSVAKAGRKGERDDREERSLLIYTRRGQALSGPERGLAHSPRPPMAPSARFPNVSDSFFQLSQASGTPRGLALDERRRGENPRHAERERSQSEGGHGPAAMGNCCPGPSSARGGGGGGGASEGEKGTSWCVGGTGGQRQELRERGGDRHRSSRGHRN